MLPRLMLTSAAAMAGLWLAVPWPAQADDAPPPADCSAPQSTYAINVCSEQEFAKADADLNAVYGKVLAFIAKNGGDKPYDSKSWEEALRASQRAWIAFRDAHCKGLVPMSWAGGTATTGEVFGCLTSMSKARTQDLQTMYELE